MKIKGFNLIDLVFVVLILISFLGIIGYLQNTRTVKTEELAKEEQKEEEPVKDYRVSSTPSDPCMDIFDTTARQQCLKAVYNAKMMEECFNRYSNG